MGCDNGISFVDVSDPDAPVYLGRLPTFEHPHAGQAPEHEGNSLWRDVRVYANHAFVVSEQPEHHMQVFDLTRLRSVASPPEAVRRRRRSTRASRRRTRSRSTRRHGLRVPGGHEHVQRRPPHGQHPGSRSRPTFAGCVSQDGYTHETQCTMYNGPDADYAGHEICFSSNVDSVTIVDVTDKSDPVQISRNTYEGSGYTHQGWLTEDQRYFLVNDELDECNMGHNSWTYIWDMADLDAPVLMGHYVSPTPAIDHNHYVRGDYLYASHYRAGPADSRHDRRLGRVPRRGGVLRFLSRGQPAQLQRQLEQLPLLSERQRDPLGHRAGPLRRHPESRPPSDLASSSPTSPSTKATAASPSPRSRSASLARSPTR